MGNSVSIKHHTLIVALLALLAAMVLRYTFIDEGNNKDRYYQQVSKRLHSELASVQNQLQLVVDNIQSSQNFTSYQQPADYPYFVFSGDSILYWSDFHYVPDYPVLNPSGPYKFIIDQGLQYISIKASVGSEDQRTIYMILPVYKFRNIQNNYIQAEFNQDIFSHEASSLEIVPQGEGNAITSPLGDYLFSISFGEQVQVKSIPIYYTIFLLSIIAIVCLLYYLHVLVTHLLKSGNYNGALLTFILGLVLVRGGMLIYDFPDSTIELSVFDPQLYASSDLNHSLGDLFLNELVLLVVVIFIFKHYLRFPWYQYLVQISIKSRNLLAVVWLTASLFFLYLQYHVITLFYHSQWSLDIASIMDFTFFKFLSLLIIIINAIVYFLITHLAIRESFRLVGKELKPILLHYLAASLIFVTVGLIFGWRWPVILLLSTLYLAVLYVMDITSYLGQYNYISFLYLFMGSLLCAIVGSYAINNYEKIEKINMKQQLADQLLNERDIVGEFLLAEAIDKIKKDHFIKNQMLFNPFASSEAILQKINRIYINQQLDRYDISVNLFDSRGDPDPGNDSFLRYQDYRSQFALETYQSDYPDLYFINEITSDLLNRYLGFIVIRQNDIAVGYVIVDLKLKRVIPNTVYPELLVYNNQGGRADNSFSYAIYANHKLINNSGSFNYTKDFEHRLFEKDALFNRGINLEGYHHLGVKGPSERTAVVSSATYPIRNVFANFSILFIIFIFCIILFILYFVFIYRDREVKLNYATRIQLYLNLAFFLPLLIVSVTTLSLISSYSKKEVIEKYFEKADGIRNNIVNTLQDYIDGNLEHAAMANNITQMSQYSELDINLFDVEGKLVGTSQPKIYEYELLSEYINPLALNDIKEEQNSSVLLNESVGTLQYKSAYVGIRSFESGELLGILSIPFFESKYELDKEIVVILTNILNIFTFIFIIILIASYFASRVLTVPLSMITQKIKKTTLTGYNEPLEWNSDDEIGLMVGEYNRMLRNLEASKTALARSEKESAWREMAQQVAHEIKNPLTPMKLTLQHLKRTLLVGNNLDGRLSEKPINTLLQQIDTLSDIATSFSSFAKMPVPENKRFEISGVLRKTIQLHDNNDAHKINFKIEGGNHFVMGDSQLMGRIFSNLIINGIQAVSANRKPVIDIILKTTDNQVIIEFKDNGSGIPEDIRDKIFIPNFSTKDTGTGIGLSIAKRGVEHAGGKIWFETTCDVGTTIFVELPLVD